MMLMLSIWQLLLEMEMRFLVALLGRRTVITSTVHALYFFPKLVYSIVTGSGALDQLGFLIHMYQWT
jgi:hypothetical protein